MKWKKRALQISLMKQKHKGERYQVPLPNLKVEHNVPPLGNQFAKVVGKRPPITGAKNYPVGNTHKSGPMLVTPGMIDNDELRFLGGKKF